MYFIEIHWINALFYCIILDTPKIKTTNHPSTTVTIKSSIQDTTDEDLTKHLDGSMFKIKCYSLKYVDIKSSF